MKAACAKPHRPLAATLTKGLSLWLHKVCRRIWHVKGWEWRVAFSVEFQIPLGTTLYQVDCRDCGAKYGILMEVNDDEHPRFCAFCCQRTAPQTKLERRV